MIPILTHSAVAITYEPESKILSVVWTTESEHISDDFFKYVNMIYVHESANRPIRGMMLNTKNFLYTISLNMQAWVNSEILPTVLQNGIKRVAFLMSEELIPQISIEQTMEEIESKIVGYFGEEAQARAWLLLA